MTQGGGRTVLVVDDDASVRAVVTSHLDRRGFVVEQADSAEAVMIGVRQRTLRYDVALIDVHLPGLSGTDLVRLLLAASPLRPVIVITGDTDAAVAQRALGYGAAGYLLKPFQLFELDAALVQAVAMLDLVEATEVLARSQAEHLDEWGEAGGMLPRAWLRLGDSHSGAGPGHGDRVGGVAAMLAEAVRPDMAGRDLDVLTTAARTHEIGRLLGPGNRAGVAGRSAELLSNLGFDPDVSELVRQASEPWSPGLPVAARILALADALDHEAERRSNAGTSAELAMGAAIGAAVGAGGVVFDPALVAALTRIRETVVSGWAGQRAATDGYRETFTTGG